MDFSIDAAAFGPNWMSNNAVIIASGSGITGDGEIPSCACCTDHESQSRSSKNEKCFLDPLLIYCLLIAIIICKQNKMVFLYLNNTLILFQTNF